MTSRDNMIWRSGLVLVLGLTACAGTSPESTARLEQQEAETREEIEALNRAVEASYDRERAMAERLRETEEGDAQLRQQVHMLQEEVAVLRTQLDTLQTMPGASGRKVPSFRAEGFDVLDTYQVALDRYRERRYDDALGRFAEILTMAPYSNLADNAQYWMGECYFGMAKPAQALTEFTKVFAYRKTEKADDAQLMIARCYMSLGEKNKALSAFQKLLDEFPESEYVAAVKREMKFLRGP